MRTTLLLQVVFALLTLLFGVLAARVAGRWGDGGRDRRALAWRITAGYFVVIGVYSTVQSVLSCFAVAEGPDSALYATVVAWGGPANAGRSLGGIAFALLLLQGQRRDLDRARASTAAVLPVILAVTAAGTLLVRWHGLTGLPHTAGLLGLGAAAMAIPLLAALLLALAREGMDEVLWLALTAYALKEVLTVSLFSLLVGWDMVDGRSLRRTLLWMGIATNALMCAAGIWRLHQLRAGRRVPALLERVRGVRRPVIGWDAGP